MYTWCDCPVAHHSDVLAMPAVVSAKASTVAAKKVRLVSGTLQFIEEDGPYSDTIRYNGIRGNCSCGHGNK